MDFKIGGDPNAPTALVDEDTTVVHMTAFACARWLRLPCALFGLAAMLASYWFAAATAPEVVGPNLGAGAIFGLGWIGVVTFVSLTIVAGAMRAASWWEVSITITLVLCMAVAMPAYLY